jgi:hypothetical protein
MLEGSNRSRVTEVATSSARDRFEAGLNETACGGRGPMGAQAKRRRPKNVFRVPCGCARCKSIDDE